MDSNKDPYELLGIKHDATTKEITRAYRKKALEFHPDKLKNFTNKMAQERQARMFMLVKQAYDVLLDDEKRAVIDNEHKAKAKHREKVNRMSMERQKMKNDLERDELAAKRDSSKAKTSHTKKYDVYSKYREEETIANREAEMFRKQAQREEAKRNREFAKQILVNQQIKEHEQAEMDRLAAKELQEINCTVRLRWSEESSFHKFEQDVEISKASLSEKNPFANTPEADTQGINEQSIKIDEGYIMALATMFGAVDHIVMNTSKSHSKNFAKKKTALVITLN
ncbi:DnaJ-like protein [Smittium mucronatum]|uniref:DnaJ-like protein n=1 Tax=Smittium mucronatum TaxID=133383 RepID=A0A1R0H278_9FUNG|nr:DnaJ-like protein [Smittium mucronatum]